MYVGIDVGGTNLKAGLVDESGAIRAVRRIPLGQVTEAGEFVRTLARLARSVAEEGGVAPETLESVGIGIPGSVSGDRIVYTCNTPFRDVAVGELFHRELPVPVVLGNDADCAAVGEYFCGAGRGSRNFVTITLGTGIGGGLILGGKLYTGMGMVGEVGHMVISCGGPLCNCGRRGCWETYASATGLIRLTREAMERNPESLLWELAARDGVSGQTAFLGAERGDETAKAVCGEYVYYLAVGVTNVVNMLQPEILAIGGGVSNADEALLRPLRTLVAKECITSHNGYLTKIVKAELGNDAGILGAALLRRAQ